MFLHTSPQGVTTQKTNIDIFTAVQISQSRIHVEELIVAELVEEFPAVYRS
jgi:hypothetical protein